MARILPIKLQVEIVLSDEARELVELLKTAIAYGTLAAAQGKPAVLASTPIPVKVTQRPPTDIEAMAADVERLAANAAKDSDDWDEPVCVFCGATSATANMFQSADDGLWRCQAHHD